MIGKNISLYLFAILLVILAGISAFYYPHLPAQVASHFDIHGNPDSYSNKNSFFMFEIIILVVVSSVFFFSAYFIKKIPETLLNLPNKEYWLAKERKEQTYKTFSSFMFWFADLTLIFLIYLFNNIFIVNTGGAKGLGAFSFYVIIAYLAATGFVCFIFIKHFMKIDQD